MKNVFSNLMWLFDMEIDESTHVSTSLCDKYILSVVPLVSYNYRCQFTGMINKSHKPQSVYLSVMILVKEPDEDVWCPNHYTEWTDEHEFLSYLKWFNDEPENLIKEYHNIELKVK